MAIDLQAIIDLYTKITIIALPLGLVILITEKIVDMFISFIFGKKVGI